MSQILNQLQLRLSSYFIKNVNISKAHYHKYKYSQKVESAINNQIQAEQQAAQDYLSFAVVFLHPRISRPGAGQFFMKMFNEELGHMQDLIQYQLNRGGVPVIKGLNAPTPIKDLTLLEAFKQSLDMEKKVTQLIECIVIIAEEEKDYSCADYLTSVFLKEQMKSVNKMAHHVTKLSRLTTEHSIYNYDKSLANL